MARILVVGLGSIGRRHATNIEAMGHIVYKVDPEGSCGEGNLWYSLEDILLTSIRLDAAVVASPSHLHYEHATTLLNAGIPVLIEKPVATTEKEVDQLWARAQLLGVTAMAGQSYRYHRGIKLLKQRISDEWIDNLGYIGRPLMVNYYSGQHLSQWCPGRDFKDTYVAQPQQGGGVLLTSATHLLDTLRFIFGGLRDVTGLATNSKSLGILVEDALVINGRTEQGALFTASSDFLQRRNEHYVKVVGTDGEATLNLNGLGGCTWDWTDGTQSEHLFLGDCSDRYFLEMQDFLDAALNKRPSPVSLLEAKIVLSIIERDIAIV